MGERTVPNSIEQRALVIYILGDKKTMTMPIDLVLVRHGESEGNAARRSSMDGDNSVFTEEFCSRHNSRLGASGWRLVERAYQSDL
jgi:hypothetical protein